MRKTPVTVVCCLVLVVLSVLCSCSRHISNFQSQPEITAEEPNLPELSSVRKDPRIIVTAHPRVGFAPLRVTFQANVQNISSSNEILVCPWEEWDFGDGSVSAEQPNCESFPVGAKATTEFVGEHLYKSGGVFAVRFTLGGDSIASNPILIRVIPRAGSR